MASHFLLSARARTKSLWEIFRMSDDEAFEEMKQARWYFTHGDPVCPRCGGLDNHFFPNRRQWRCRYCRHTFSVTSDTIFAYSKLPLQKCLAAVLIFTNAVKGISASQLMRDLDVQYKTAFVLLGKLREAVLNHPPQGLLAGEVEIDATPVNRYLRPANKKKNRKDRRLTAHRSDRERCVLALKQRGNPALGIPEVTRVFVLHSENQTDINRIVRKHVAPGSHIFTDGHSAYNTLRAWYVVHAVNHSLQYSAGGGLHINKVEAYFSRLGRLLQGQIHSFDVNYIIDYATETALRDDLRRKSNGVIFENVLIMCTRSRPSRDWCGYWQGNKRLEEKMAA